MKNILEGNPRSIWSNGEKLLFRTGFVFFLLLIIPLDWKFWRQLVSTHLGHFQDLFHLVNYFPHFISTYKWGVASFASVGLALGLSLILCGVWSHFDRDASNYVQLYDWLRILLRYKLALALISYGLIQLFLLQFPALTLSDLNTNYVDFLPWKIYYLTNSAASARYEATVGLFEVLSGALLLGRRFTTIGAAIATAILVNVVVVNFAYQIGDHVYATFLFGIALVLLGNDAVRIFDLLVRRRKAFAEQDGLLTHDPQFKTVRLVLRVAVLLFFVVYAADTYAAYKSRSWPYPNTADLADSAGLYNVKEFTINGNTLPYSLIDPVRWQNVVFEKWNTISIRIHRPVTIHLANPDIAYQPSDDRDYELAGNGGRHFYSYTSDLQQNRIHLVGKNDPNESYSFSFTRPNANELVLAGTDEKGNTLNITLERVDKQYLLEKGRRNPLTLY
jgi:hypothetical protein